MTLNDLIYMTRLYARDNNSYVFNDTMIKLFLNQGIDRIRQYKYLRNIPHLEYVDDEVKVLPDEYAYMIALFASSRCFEHDERFFEATERRNEFEALLEDLIGEIQCGNIVITDDDGNELEDDTCCTDVVKDVYFNTSEVDEEWVEPTSETNTIPPSEVG